MKKNILFVLLFSLIINLFGCNFTNKNNNPASLSGFYFDTPVTITIYDNMDQTKTSKIIRQCFDICKKYENLFSRTVSTSDISKINESHGRICAVNSDTIDIINHSINFSKMSNGAFDITIANLITLWNIKSENPKVPKKSLIKKELNHIKYKNIITNSSKNTVILKDKDAALDLGGIAKGYIADKLKANLKTKGITSAIINLGGNILVVGSKKNNDYFTIGIQKPFGNNDNGTEYSATVAIKDKSIVTSGIYQRYFKKDGNIYHHILDTSTGYPVKNNLYSVTIISNKSEDGDGLSTSVLALGYKKGKALIESLPNTEAIFITNNYDVLITSGLTIDSKNKISLK